MGNDIFLKITNDAGNNFFYYASVLQPLMSGIYESACRTLEVTLSLPTTEMASFQTAIFSGCGFPWEVWTSGHTTPVCCCSSPSQSSKLNFKKWLEFLCPSFTALQLFLFSLLPLLSNRMCQALYCQQISFMLLYCKNPSLSDGP